MSQHTYESVLQRLRALVPAKLMTCTFVDFDAMEAIRVFSTMEDIFPVQGRKKVVLDSEWSYHIHRDKKSYSINRVRDYPEHFYDWELIESAGLCSAMCIPIIQGDTVVGSMNILDAEGAYKDAPTDELVRIASDVSVFYADALNASRV